MKKTILSILILTILAVGVSATTDYDAYGNVALWLDATNLTGSNGTSVTVWEDFSGNNLDAYVPTGSTSPTILSNDYTRNNKTALRFANTDRTVRLQVNSSPFLNSGDVTVFVVAKGQTSMPLNRSNRIIITKNGTNSNSWAIRTEDGLTDIFYNGIFRPNADPGTAYIFDSLSPTSQQVLVHTLNANSTKFTYLINDYAQDNISVGTVDTTSGPITIGNNGEVDNGSGYDFYEIIVFNETLTLTEITGVYDLLNAKWQVNEAVIKSSANPVVDKASQVRAGDLFEYNATHIGMFYTNTGNNIVYYTVAPKTNVSDWDQGVRPAIFNSSAAGTAWGEVSRMTGFKSGSTWHVYYDDRENGTIGYASGPFLENLTRASDSAIFNGTGSDWEQFVRRPSARLVGDTIYLIYDGRKTTSTSGFGSIGYATAPLTNPVQLTRAASNPILEPTTDWQADDVGSPAVHYESILGLWHLGYIGYNDDFGDGSNFFPHQAGYATGSSLDSLTRYSFNPVISYGYTRNYDRFSINGLGMTSVADTLVWSFGAGSGGTITGDIGIATSSLDSLLLYVSYNGTGTSSGTVGEIAGDGLASVENVTDQFGVIGTIVGVAILLTLVIVAFQFGRR